MCRKFAKETGAPTLTLHELRHTHASLLLRAGVHPKIVQERRVLNLQVPSGMPKYVYEQYDLGILGDVADLQREYRRKI